MCLINQIYSTKNSKQRNGMHTIIEDVQIAFQTCNICTKMNNYMFSLLTYVAWWFHYSCQAYGSKNATCSLHNDRPSLDYISFAEVETGQYTNIALEDYIYKLCCQKGQPEDHCQAYSEIREIHHCFFTEGFEPLA